MLTTFERDGHPLGEMYLRRAVRGQNISCGGKLAVQEVNGRGFEEEDRPLRERAT